MSAFLTYRTSIAMVDRESKSGEKRNDDTALEGCFFVVGLYDPVHDSITDPILDLGLVHHSTNVHLVSSTPETSEKTYEDMKNWFSM